MVVKIHHGSLAKSAKSAHAHGRLSLTETMLLVAAF